MKAKLLITIGLGWVTLGLWGQTPDTLQRDTLPSPGLTDSLRIDSTATGLSVGVPMSADSVDATVEYNARDSMIIDATGEKIHLYGDAVVTYTTITLRAAHIELDLKKSEVIASAVPNDTTGQLMGIPEFAEGDNNFTANRMRYNFETRKGIVYDNRAEQDDIIVRGAKAKFISGPANDSTANDIIYSENATFTTCTAEHPHFLIRSRKQKVIPDKLVIVGASNLEIMNIPTPLWLPFGFFPVSRNRQTGLIFPRDYEYSNQFGFGLRQVGWFFPLGDHFNLTLSGDIYLKGTWGIGANVQYRRRYRYNGNFTLRFDSRRQEVIENLFDAEGEPILGPNGEQAQRAFFDRQNGIYLSWSHRQDAAAHPMNTLSGSINFQTNNFQQRVFNDARSVQNNIINSNFSFNRNWQDKPISMSVAFRHSQNNNTRIINIDFPTFQFQTQALYPFRRKERIGPERWYENITMRYTNEARARFTGLDTTFFRQETLDEARYGVRQDVSMGTSFKLFKYFNLNPGANYREVWNFRSFDAQFQPVGLVIDTTVLANGELQLDTLDYGTYNIDTLSGLGAFRTFNANVSLNTQLFSNLPRFKLGPLRGLRHVIKPSVSIGYQPDYTSPTLNYYQTLPDTSDIAETVQFSRFQDGLYGSPPSSEMALALNYSITNIFEAKVFSRRDSTEKNIKLFDNLYINGNYNFAADSLNWSPINTSGTARFFKGATTFSFNAQFDPHLRVNTANGGIRRINRTVWEERKRPFEFVSASFRLNTNLTVGKIRAIFQGQEEEVVTDVRDTIPPDQFAINEETDFLSLFENFSIRHNMNFGFTPITADRDTFRVTTNSIELRGSINLTPNWAVDIGSIGYDFVSKRTTYPFLNLRRDLHCWEMGFSWAPTRNTYSFYLRVKPGTLDFLKVPYQRNNVDGQNAFR